MWKVASILIICLYVQSCGDTTTSGGRSVTDESFYSNRVSQGNGLILTDNPIFLSQNTGLPDGTDFNTLPVEEKFITFGGQLASSCSSPTGNPNESITDCFKVLRDNTSQPLAPVNGRWGFNPNGESFLQVHTFYHTTLTVQRFMDSLTLAYNVANPAGTFGAGTYPTAIPASLYSSGAYWYDFPLIVYSNCQTGEGVAFFDPTNHTICFGQDTSFNNFILSQDSTVIYHEVAHAMVKTATNFRNKSSSSTFVSRTDFGHYFYDEGGSINEAYADYASFRNNMRTHFGEWALGRFYQASRPMTEGDPQHGNSVDAANGERLSYPDRINYDSNFPTQEFEDIHLTGQVVSHFFTALFWMIKNGCSTDYETAFRYLDYVFIETLSELGDLTAKGFSNHPNELLKQSGETIYNVNLRQFNGNGELVSKLWAEIVRPPNYYTFFQTFSKYFHYLFTAPNKKIQCNGIQRILYEQLLDSYGLLLFDTYNDNGQDSKYGHSGALTRILANRRTSLVATKNNLALPSDVSGRNVGNLRSLPDFFVFDNKRSMRDTIDALKSTGSIYNLSPIMSDTLQYNNGDGQIGAGEIVGIALNIYNNSNITMAGVQVLANPWDHTKFNGVAEQPCRTFGTKNPDDPTFTFPSLSQGAIDASGETGSVGDCSYITRTNGHDPSNDALQEVISPICLVQTEKNGVEVIVTQEAFFEETGVSELNCLIPGQKRDCFIRAIPGGDTAFYSKVAPNSTWGQTFFESQADAIFDTSGIIYFEVNESTPTNTRFFCRFRARYTNCNDCWRDPTRTDFDDYLDYEYSGPRPYKIFDIDFYVRSD